MAKAHSLKYKVIKTTDQYHHYCHTLEELTDLRESAYEDEIELLTLLIERWDIDHNTFQDLDPIELSRVLMKENELKQKDLVELLGLSKGTISKILNYQKGLSKESIRKLAKHFKVSQEAFNRSYKLIRSEGKGNATYRQDLLAHR